MNRPPVRIALLALLFILSCLLLWHFELSHIFSLKTIQQYGGALQDYIALNRTRGMLIFVAVYIVTVCLCFPVAALLDLVGGFLFGTWVGGGLILCGAVTGAVIVFLIAQTSLGKPLRAKAGPFYTRAAREMHQGAAGYLLFLRLVPLLPFALVNIIPALLHVRLRTFIWTTIIGITPMTFVYANLGQTLGSINRLEDLFSPELATALGLLGLLALGPVAVRKLRTRRAAELLQQQDIQKRTGADEQPQDHPL